MLVRYLFSSPGGNDDLIRPFLVSPSEPHPFLTFMEEEEINPLMEYHRREDPFDYGVIEENLTTHVNDLSSPIQDYDIHRCPN